MLFNPSHSSQSFWSYSILLILLDPSHPTQYLSSYSILLILLNPSHPIQSFSILLILLNPSHPTQSFSSFSIFLILLNPSHPYTISIILIVKTQNYLFLLFLLTLVQSISIPRAFSSCVLVLSELPRRTWLKAECAENGLQTKFFCEPFSKNRSWIISSNLQSVPYHIRLSPSFYAKINP